MKENFIDLSDLVIHCQYLKQRLFEGSSDNWHGTPGTYSTDFEANVAGTVEHFDVYGEVQTLYSQVYWTRNLPVNLPPEIVNRFNGSVMAITGYEIDQVIHTGPMVKKEVYK